VFGIPLDFLMNTERERGRMIPRIVESSINLMLVRGVLEQEGIFRLSGKAKDVEQFKDSVQRGGALDFGFMDIFTVAGVLKMWFRDLPEPITTHRYYEELVDHASMLFGL
jgi:hypothetical protein